MVLMVKAMVRERLGVAAPKPELSVVGGVKKATQESQKTVVRLRPLERRRLAANS